ncbi:hypothetical protein BDZ89DRAFT_694335 [Hymenopellis radicata]|nr:hypothetical protein BDZ89DRAFT_694335 [Hymenopellis radicata]
MSSTPPTLAASRIVGSTNASLDDAVSNLSRLLYTNDSPSSQHAVFVSEWTRLLDDSIVQLDAAIADASAVPSLISSTTPCASINEQKTQRANLRRLRDQVQSVNSTVRQVPPEIWQQIFLFVHQSSDNGMSVFDRRDPVYRIGQVCQKWRRISHHCPRLWSRLYVDGTQVSNLSRGVSHLRTVLERSCRAPLDFIFGYEGSSRDEEREVPARLLSLLMQYSSRWRSAEFTGLTFLEALLLRSVRGQIPHLQSVGLALYVEDIGSERADMVTAFEVAPELSQVNLKGIPLSQVLLDPCAKQNLCSLRVNHSAAADLMFSCRTPTLSDVLRTYPKLTNISHRRSFLDAVTWPTPPPLDTPRTVYTNITSLSVADGDSINVISLPNLTDLDAGFGGRDFVEGLFPCVVSLLQHSRCRLSSLRLQYAEWDKDSMGVLLSLVPDLETLSISSGGCRRLRA